MGWRFRQRINLFPGVRLNISGSGLSLTVGAPGASVNFGPRGTHLNLGVPGSGVSYRTRLDAPQGRPNRPPTPVPASPTRRPQDRYGAPAEPAEAIRSADVIQLTSGDLADLKRLILDAEGARARLLAEVEATDRRRRHARRRLVLSSAFLVRLLTFWTWPAQHRRLTAEEAAHREACVQLERCRIDLDFALDEPTLQRFAQVEQAFSALAQAARIWDVTSQAATNRAAQRTLATHSIERTSVRFRFSRSPVLGTGRDALVLGNANGEELFVYPAFLMLHERRGDIALVDLRSLRLLCEVCPFIEEDGVPEDARVIGRTWKRTNKDGSPDRRFRDNYEIPVARYAWLELGSPTGLREAYLVSREEAAARFAEAFGRYQLALRAAVDRAPAAEPAALPPPEDAEPEPPTTYRPLPEVQPARWFPTADLAAAGLAAIVTFGVLVKPPEGPALAPTHASKEPVTMPAPAPGGVSPASPPTAAAAPLMRALGAIQAQRVRVRVPTANVRAAPSPTAAIVGTVRSGRVLEVLGRDGEWLRVGDGAPLGWVRGDLVSTDSP